jgi:hypothetical protein
VSSMALQVAGLNDIRRGLKGVDRELPKGVRLVLNQVANVLIDATKPKIPTRSGAARDSLKAASSQTTARISAGGRRAPYYPWLDFGGTTGRKKSVKRAFYKKGRYIYVTLGEQHDAIQEAMFKGIATLAAGNGIDVS